jgi:hypothetical protein
MHLLQDGKICMDLDDEMTRATLVTHQGEIVSDALQAIFGAAPRDP